MKKKFRDYPSSPQRSGVAILSEFSTLNYYLASFCSENNTARENLMKHVISFNEQMSGDDAAADTVPLFLNFVSKGFFQLHHESFEIAEKLIHRSNSLFPEEPIHHMFEDQLGCELVEEKAHKVEKKKISMDAAKQWEGLGRKFLDAADALEEQTGVLRRQYLERKEHLGGGRWLNEFEAGYNKLLDNSTDLSRNLKHLSIRLRKAGLYIESIVLKQGEDDTDQGEGQIDSTDNSDSSSSGTQGGAELREVIGMGSSTPSTEPEGPVLGRR